MIYPLYYGNWSSADIATQQNFLTRLTAYLSGAYAPAGITGVSDGNLHKTIHANQASGNLPPYSSNTLIMVFTSSGIDATSSGQGTAPITPSRGASTTMRLCLPIASFNSWVRTKCSRPPRIQASAPMWDGTRRWTAAARESVCGSVETRRLRSSPPKACNRNRRWPRSRRHAGHMDVFWMTPGDIITSNSLASLRQ